jgi:hypothetical protein
MEKITAEEVAELTAKIKDIIAARVATRTLYEADGGLTHDVFKAQRNLELQAPKLPALIAEQDAEIKRYKEALNYVVTAAMPADTKGLVYIWDSVVEKVKQALTKEEV